MFEKDEIVINKETKKIGRFYSTSSMHGMISYIYYRRENRKIIEIFCHISKNLIRKATKEEKSRFENLEMKYKAQRVAEKL